MTVIQSIVPSIAIAALLAFAALRDVATRTVPNWVSLAILGTGCGLQAAAGTLPSAAAAAAALFAAAFLIWRKGWIGGADVKLLAACGICVPASDITTLVMTTAMAGGSLALIYLSLSLVVRRPAPGRRDGIGRRIMKAEAWRIHKRAPIPYAAAIAAGSFFTLIRG